MAWPDPSRYARDRVVARARARSRSLSVCARFGCWHTITGAGGTIQLQHGARASASGTNETTSRVSRNHMHRWMHGRRTAALQLDSGFRVPHRRAPSREDHSGIPCATPFSLATCLWLAASFLVSLSRACTCTQHSRCCCSLPPSSSPRERTAPAGRILRVHPPTRPPRLGGPERCFVSWGPARVTSGSSAQVLFCC